MEQNTPEFENLDNCRKELAQMIGVHEDRLLEYPIIKVNTGLWWLVFGLKSLDDLKNISPDLNKNNIPIDEITVPILINIPIKFTIK